MNKKLIALCTLLVFILVACASSGQQNLPTPTPGVSALAIQKFAHSQILTASANGIEMSVANIRLENDVLKLDVCYQKPSNEDWLVYDVFIETGETKTVFSGGSGIEETTTMENGQRQIYTFANRATGTSGQTQYVEHNGLPDYRCDTLDFQITSELELSHFNLVIEAINFSWPEDGDCKPYRDAVQDILNEQNTGIMVNCVNAENGFGMSVRVAEKPDSMTQEEAQNLLSSATNEVTRIEGPWVFSGTIDQ